MRTRALVSAISVFAILAAESGCMKSKTTTETREAGLAQGGAFVLKRFEELGFRQASLDDLLRDAIFTFSPSVSTPTLSRSLFDAINASAAYSLQLSLNDQGVSRVDTFKAGQDVGRLLLMENGKVAPLPFKINKGEEIQFVRVFANPAQAAAALPPSLTSIPTTVDLALALPEGTSVIIPTNTKVVVGAPLQLAGKVNGLNVAAGISARAILEGSFRIEVTRGKGSLVRVRIAERTTDGLQFGASGEIGLPLKVLFLSQDLKAAAELSAEVSRGLRFSADYELDLASPAARDAYERALGGRVILATADQLASPWHLKDETLADFTGLDATAAQPNSGVRERSSILDSYDAKKATLRIASPFFSYGIESGFSNNKIAVEQEGSPTVTYGVSAHVFGFDNRTALFRGGDKKASGFLATEEHLQKGLPGAHWFQWARSEWAAGTRDMALDELRNALAPGWGLIPANLPELPNMDPTSVKLRVVLSDAAMEALFNPQKVNAEVLATALANMARTFKTQFILPYNQAPFKPTVSVPEVTGPKVAEACEIVSQQWGRFYCGFFVKEFIPEYLALQNGSSATNKAVFFKRFYTQGLGLNRFGGQVLIRYLSEVLGVLGISDGISAEASLSWPAPRYDQKIPTTVFRVGSMRYPEVLGYVSSAVGF